MRNIIFLLASLFILNGCASTTQVQSPKQLHKTNGYVYVSVPKGSGSDVARLKSVQTGSTYTLAKRQGKVPARGLWLPPGSYQFAEWNGQTLNDYPLISVESGRLTDMGSLVEMSVGGYQYVVLPLKTEEFSSEVRKVLTEYDSFFATKQPIQWDVKKAPKPFKKELPYSGMGLIFDLLVEYERHVNMPSISQRLLAAESIADFLALGKSITPPTGYEPAIDASGRYLFSADLGQIRTRNESGRWGNIDTGSLHKLVAIEAANNVITVGLSDGSIRSSKDLGLTWRHIASLGGEQRIIDIDYVAGRWFVMAATVVADTAFLSQAVRFDQVKIYSAAKDDLSDLSVIKVIKPKADNFLLLQAEKTKDAYYILVPPEFLKLDITTMTWSSMKTPDEVYSFHVKHGPEKITAFSTVNAKAFFSANGGKSWEKRAFPPQLGTDILFENASDGRAVRWNASMFSGIFESLKYDHGNDKWLKDYDVHEACKRVFSDGKQIDKFCITSGGSIFSNSNGKWNLEFASE